MTLDGPVHILTVETGRKPDAIPHGVRSYCGSAFWLERDATARFHAGPHLWFIFWDARFVPGSPFPLGPRTAPFSPALCFAFRAGAPPGLALPRPLSPYCEECLAHYTVKLLLERDRPALSRPDAGLCARPR